MPKIITMYQCEICNFKHTTLDHAVQCEAKGIEKPLANVGDLVSYKIELDDGYGSFNVNLRISEVKLKGHVAVYQFEEEYSENEWHDAPYESYGNSDFEMLIKIK